MRSLSQLIYLTAPVIVSGAIVNISGKTSGILWTLR